MSEDQLKACLAALKADSQLIEKVKAAADTAAVVAIATESGFRITAEDLSNRQADLTEEELDGVAAGFLMTPNYGCHMD